MGWHFVTGLLQQATEQGSRSTVLRPLGWLLAISGAIALGALEFKADIWVSVVFVTICALAAALYLGAYIFCLIYDRDALRSETYSIQKLAIQKGSIGDSATGLLEGGLPGLSLPGNLHAEEKK
jgi:hypothetical protein